MSVLLETVDLKKTYHVGKVDVEALRGVSITVNSGEFVAIMGPSGCGKSTLMHLLGAMTRATSGKVLVEGRDTSNMNDAARTVDVTLYFSGATPDAKEKGRGRP